MAVQKSKKSRAKRGTRRSHDALVSNESSFSEDETTGELHLRHNMTEDGYYRGRKVLQISLQLELICPFSVTDLVFRLDFSYHG